MRQIRILKHAVIVESCQGKRFTNVIVSTGESRENLCHIFLNCDITIDQCDFSDYVSHCLKPNTFMPEVINSIPSMNHMIKHAFTGKIITPTCSRLVSDGLFKLVLASLAYCVFNKHQ